MLLPLDRRFSAIVFSEAMLNQLDIREIGGVMAHEIAHIENHDLVLMNISNTLWRFTHNLCNIAQILVIVMLPLLLVGMLNVFEFNAISIFCSIFGHINAFSFITNSRV